MSVLVDFFKQHRTAIGWVVGFIAGGFAGTGHTQIAQIITPLATLLLGAGHFESDAYHRES